MASPEQPPLPLLFLIGDTGGGHRSAAAAVQQSLERVRPGRFAPVICDPLRGPDVPGLLRWLLPGLAVLARAPCAAGPGDHIAAGNYSGTCTRSVGRAPNGRAIVRADACHQQSSPFKPGGHRND